LLELRRPQIFSMLVFPVVDMRRYDTPINAPVLPRLLRKCAHAGGFSVLQARVESAAGRRDGC